VNTSATSRRTVGRRGDAWSIPGLLSVELVGVIWRVVIDDHNRPHISGAAQTGKICVCWLPQSERFWQPFSMHCGLPLHCSSEEQVVDAQP